METHFLKLAYLAETAIVFNLAYIELKWPSEIEKLKNRVDSFKDRQFAGSQKQAICEKKKCEKCNKQKPQLNEKYNINYIQEILKNMSTFLISNPPIAPTKEAAEKIWEMSNHAESKACSDLYYKVGQEQDKSESRLAVILSTIILISITALDLYWGPIILSPYPEFFQKWEWEISTVLAIVLTICVIIPVNYWRKWNFLLIEFECLYIRLSKAFQDSASSEIGKAVGDNFFV